MSQTSLFTSLPNMNRTEGDRQRNKELAKRAGKPRKAKTISTRAGLENKLATMIEVAEKYFKHDDELELVTSESRLSEYVEVIKQNGIVALDTETTGLNPISNKIVGIGLKTPDEKSIYIPMRHTDLSDSIIDGQLSSEIVGSYLKEIEDVKFVYYNAVFDMRFIFNEWGIWLPAHWCGHIAASYLNENERHGLKNLWDKYCNKSEDKSAQFSDVFEGIPFNYVPLDIAKAYGADDPRKTYELYEFQKQFLDPESDRCREQGLDRAGIFFKDVEMPLTHIVAKMEQNGVFIDKEFSQRLSLEYNQRQDEIQEKIYNYISTLDLNNAGDNISILSNPVNLNSPIQLAIIFYDIMGMKSPERRSPRGTAESILKHFAEESGGDQKEFFENILELRGVAKLLSTYIDKLPNEILEETGKLHGRFHQYGTVTGRFSSTEPNLQNIPSRNKAIRRMFIPPKGEVFICADYSQQEPRILTHISTDPELARAYKEGRDLYSWVASIVFHTSYEECKPFKDGKPYPEGDRRRESAKSIVLGMMYGRGERSIAEQLGTSVEEARDIITRFFRQFPQIKPTIDRYHTMAINEGYIYTVYGRKRRLPDLALPHFEFKQLNGDGNIPQEVANHYARRLNKAWWNEKDGIKQEARRQGILVTDNGGKIAEAQRQVINSVVQGSASDVTKKAMLNVARDERLNELGYKLLLTVHDEIIGSCPKEHALECAEQIEQIMIDAPAKEISIPMKVTAEIVECWFGENIRGKLQNRADES